MLLSLPLVIAAAKLYSPRWYPTLDWAWTEIKVRDVASSHPPLIGLAGRIGQFGRQLGSHPGPISFYLLFPVWKLLGGSSNALFFGNVVLDIAAIGMSLWLAFRRGGAMMMFAVAALLAALMRAYGVFLLTLPWNPFLPVLWWFLFLLAIWSLLEDDVVAFPVAAFAGTFCVQTHVSYLGLVSGLFVFGVAVVVWRTRRRRDDATRRRLLRRCVFVAAVIVVVCWVPPVIDQIVHHPGNLTTIRNTLSGPSVRPIGLVNGVRVLFAQLNPIKLGASPPSLGMIGPARVSGSTLPGTVLLVAWAMSVVGAWRLRARRVLSLDAVLGVGLVLAVVSTSRIVGDVWYYLMLWSYALSALLLFATCWTAIEYAKTLGHDLRRGAVALLSAVLVAATAAMTVSATSLQVMTPRLNRQMAALVPPTVDAVRQLHRSGRHGPYLVTFLPPAQFLGGEGYALLNELLRQGFDARMSLDFRAFATRYHVIRNVKRASTQVHLATGIDIPYWRADPRFREIAYYDPRTSAERAEFDRLRTAVIAAFDRAGLTDLKPRVDTNLLGVLLMRRRLPPGTRKDIERMVEMGLPAAIYIGPVAEPKGDPLGAP
jgi:hypothetical protein